MPRVSVGTIITPVVNEFISFRNNDFKVSVSAGSCKGALNDAARSCCLRCDNIGAMPRVSSCGSVSILMKKVIAFQDDCLEVSG